MQQSSLSARRMAERLRALLQGENSAAEILEPGLPADFQPAAVLVPLICRGAALAETWSVVLTRRTDHLHHHPGQISFPGGRVEVQDRGPEETALRETEEEIGLHREQVEVLGRLPVYRTVTGFAIEPLVGIVHPPYHFTPDPFEVAEVFEVPLDFLLDPANHRQEAIEYQGRMRSYYAIPYRNYPIWGATAGMLVSLYRLLVDEVSGGRPQEGAQRSG